MGGDNAPISNIKGSIQFLDEINDSSIHIYFVGDKSQILSHRSYFSKFENQISIIHSSDVIKSDERSAKFHKTRPDSSLVKSVNLIKEKQADAVISAGNTGALLTTSLFLIGKIPGISRPALAPYIPTQ